MTQNDRITLVVDGRTFVQEPPTFEQEMYILDCVVETGIDKIPELQVVGTEEEPDLEQVAKQMIIRAYRSGALFKLMGSLVVEEGEEWSEALALEQAEIFRTTRDPEAKKQLQPALVGAVLAFFESGVRSVESSLISLVPNESKSDSRSKHVDVPSLTPEQAEAVFRTGSMRSPSSKSPITTGSTPSRSSTGKSGTASSPAKKSAGRSRGKSTTRPA